MLSTTGNRPWRLPVVTLAALGILPFLVTNAYYRDWMFMAYLWGGLSAAWNIIGGYAGQLSIGHAMFFGLGAYASTLLYVDFGLSPWVGMLVGGLIAVLAAFVLGATTFRLRGSFFVLSTIAFSEVLRLMAIAWRSLTRGSLGIIIDFKPSLAHMTWRGKLPYVYLAFAYMALIYILCIVIERTKFGYSLVALRENEDAAQALGVNTARNKVIALVLSAFLTAVGGTLYAQYRLFIEPDMVFRVMVSVQMTLIAIIGGLGTALGPIIGALLLVPLSGFLRGELVMVSGLHGLVYSLALIVVIRFAPRGIFGYFSRRTHSGYSE